VADRYESNDSERVKCSKCPHEKWDHYDSEHYGGTVCCVAKCNCKSAEWSPAKSRTRG
jgi:hypothetical protein